MTQWLYEDVAGQIAQQIEDGVYSPGDRLPGIRKLSQQFGVSLATAVEACQLLEDRGMIRARPRSGFYVQELEGRACGVAQTGEHRGRSYSGDRPGAGA